MQTKSKGIARAGVRYLKCALFALIWLAVLPSCVTAYRCAKKFPAVTDTVFTETVRYHDTTFYYQLPADTIVDSVAIVSPCPEKPPISSQPVKVDSRFAYATAAIVNNSLRLRLVTRDTLLAKHIDSLAVERTRTVVVTNTKTIKERFVPVFYKVSLGVNLVLILLFIIGIYLSLRR